MTHRLRASDGRLSAGEQAALHDLLKTVRDLLSDEPSRS
jgi:hypothetical protein